MGRYPGKSGLANLSTARRFPLELRYSIGHPRSRKHPRDRSLLALVEGIFLGYHIQPGFVFKAEYLVAPLYEIHNAIKNEAFKVFRTKRLETLEGDFVYPLVDAEHEPSKPPNLDDQHHNVIEDKNPHPPLEEGGKDLFGDINFDGSPLSEFYKPGEIREQFGDLFDDVDNPPLEDAEDNAAREGESEEASKAKKRAALLDDVPHSIKKNLATVSAPARPHGYFWNGECLIKKKGNSRPDGIDNTSWRNMSKRQRAEAVERKVQAVYEAEYEAAVKAVPAMPVLIGKGEEHRERLLPLLHKKLLEVSSDMYAVVAKVLSPKEVSTNPAAQAALDKEWQKLVDKVGLRRKSGSMKPWPQRPRKTTRRYTSGTSSRLAL